MFQMADWLGSNREKRARAAAEGRRFDLQEAKGPRIIRSTGSTSAAPPLRSTFHSTHSPLETPRPPGRRRRRRPRPTAGLLLIERWAIRGGDAFGTDPTHTHKHNTRSTDRSMAAASASPPAVADAAAGGGRRRRPRRRRLQQAAAGFALILQLVLALLLSRCVCVCVVGRRRRHHVHVSDATAFRLSPQSARAPPMSKPARRSRPLWRRWDTPRGAGRSSQRGPRGPMGASPWRRGRGGASRDRRFGAVRR